MASAVSGRPGHISGRLTMPVVEARTSLSFFEAREMIWYWLTADTSRSPRVTSRTLSSTEAWKMSP
ncbi:hypothetical protein D3C80_1819650 [compost metagenome]